MLVMAFDDGSIEFWDRKSMQKSARHLASDTISNPIESGFEFPSEGYCRSFLVIRGFRL